MEHSLIVGRNSEQKARVTKQLLKGYVNKVDELIVFDGGKHTNYYYDLMRYENVTHTDYIEVLHYIIDDVYNTDEKIVIFLNNYVEEFKSKKYLADKIIELMEHNENVTFIISCEFIGHNRVFFDELTEKTKDKIRNRIIFQVNCMLDRNTFDVDIDRWNRIGNLKADGEFIAYRKGIN